GPGRRAGGCPLRHRPGAGDRRLLRRLEHRAPADRGCDHRNRSPVQGPAAARSDRRMTRSQAEPEAEPVLHESHVSIGHGPGRTPERLMIVGLVLLVLLVIKPWGATPEPATAPRPVASVAPTD